MQHYAMLLNKLVDLVSLQCLDVKITFVSPLDKKPYRCNLQWYNFITDVMHIFLVISHSSNDLLSVHTNFLNTYVMQVIALSFLTGNFNNLPYIYIH